MKSWSQNPQRFLPWSRGGSAPGLSSLYPFLVECSSALRAFPKPAAGLTCTAPAMQTTDRLLQACVLYKETEGCNHFLLNKANDSSSGQPSACIFLWGEMLELPAAAGMHTKPLAQYLKDANCSLTKLCMCHLCCLLSLKRLAFICSFCFIQLLKQSYLQSTPCISNPHITTF